jgi:hypothetical protein
VVVVGLLALALVAPALPAGAQEGPAPRPDVLVRRFNEPSGFGEDIYNWDSAGQTIVALVVREGTVRFVARLENDGSAPSDLVVRGSRNTDTFGIRYFVAGEEVSTRVRNGVYRFPAVGPGGHRAVTVQITARAAAEVGDRVAARLSVRDRTQIALRDRVKMVVYRNAGPEAPIVDEPFTNVATAERWAEDQGASARFVQNAALYWEQAVPRGIRPEVAYAQSGKETGYGNFGGVIDATWRNPCGLKTTEGGSNDDPEAHQRFDTWRQGVTACIDHLALYAGAPGYPRMNTPDPRHFPFLRGTARTVERLGGRWAPDPEYGRSIVIDYLNPLLGS